MKEQSKFVYYLDFFLAPIAAALLILHVCLFGLQRHVMPGLIIGIVAWTFIEYVIHWITHLVVSKVHIKHHLHPYLRIGPTSLTSVPAYLAIFGVLYLIFGLGVAASVVSGILLGFTNYLIIHDRIHRGFMLTNQGARHCERHETHHRRSNRNFGVSTPFWDWVFNTEYRK